MSEVWKTKYGPRRVRRDPPTLQEAIAAPGLTDDLQEQVEIASSLMEVPPEQVKAELLRSGGQRKDIRTVGVTGRPGSMRTVVVERKVSRRPGAGKGTVR